MAIIPREAPRKAEVIKPISTKTRPWSVSIWEIDDYKDAKPREMTPFKVDAYSYVRAVDAIDQEMAKRKRRIRTLGLADDGRFLLVVFTGTRKVLKPDDRPQRAAVLSAHARRQQLNRDHLATLRATRPKRLTPAELKERREALILNRKKEHVAQVVKLHKQHADRRVEQAAKRKQARDEELVKQKVQDKERDAARAKSRQSSEKVAKERHERKIRRDSRIQQEQVVTESENRQRKEKREADAAAAASV